MRCADILTVVCSMLMVCLVCWLLYSDHYFISIMHVWQMMGFTGTEVSFFLVFKIGLLSVYVGGIIFGSAFFGMIVSILLKKFFRKII